MKRYSLVIGIIIVSMLISASAFSKSDDWQIMPMPESPVFEPVVEINGHTNWTVRQWLVAVQKGEETATLQIGYILTSPSGNVVKYYDILGNLVETKNHPEQPDLVPIYIDDIDYDLTYGDGGGAELSGRLALEAQIGELTDGHYYCPMMKGTGHKKQKGHLHLE